MLTNALTDTEGKENSKSDVKTVIKTTKKTKKKNIVAVSNSDLFLSICSSMDNCKILNITKLNTTFVKVFFFKYWQREY